MDVKTSFAAQTYAQARSATRPSQAGTDGSITAAVGSFAETMRNGEETATAAMLGKADPHALVEALAASELAIETAVTLRDKVVEAYLEILRMPV